MTKLDRHHLMANPDVIFEASAPCVVTLWVPSETDSEERVIESSRVYVTIDDPEKCRLWKGTPLMFEMFHKFMLEPGQQLWAVTRDEALIGIQVDPIQ